MGEANKSPWKRQRLSFGQWTADRLAEVAGSWGFIVGFFFFLAAWIAVNLELLFVQKWDPYPFILLNLLLSCLAAIQAPVILMSQNRAAERDRHQARKDYYINRKAEKEIKTLQMQVLELKQLLSKQSVSKESEKIETEIKAIQRELEGMSKTLQIE
jgi:uncharacterized membrane protein